MDVRFGTWNVRSLCMSGLLKTVARGLGKYTLGIMGVQEVRWEKGGTEQAEDYTYFYRAGNEDRHIHNSFIEISSVVWR
jgi:hypothetical protein